MTKAGEPMKFIKKAVEHQGEECLTWPYGKGSTGYGQIWFNGKFVSVNRFICSVIYGEPPQESYVVAHSCGKGHEGCCNHTHMRWATRKNNMADQLLHGTRNRDIRHGNSKLNDEKVRAIRKDPRSQRDVAVTYNIHYVTVNDILTGKTWGWLS